jgi:PHD/YefM family antitoxin component YafN of YafNO toxin-antitoxin module
MPISANELKMRGISAIEDSLGLTGEAIITVRGKERFVVMDMEYYNYLRECELEAALHQARADVKAGNCTVESVDDHIRRLKDEI